MTLAFTSVNNSHGTRRTAAPSAAISAGRRPQRDHSPIVTAANSTIPTARVSTTRPTRTPAIRSLRTEGRTDTESAVHKAAKRRTR